MGLFEAGVNVFRLNVSHGTQEDHARRIQAVRRISSETGLHVGILLDLQGPKIRLGTFQNGGCALEDGSLFTLTTQPVEGTSEIASTSYPEFARDVKPGNRVLLADGALELDVLSTDGIAVRCRVVRGGWISDRKGINLPGVAVSTPSLSKKDVADAHFGVEQGVDFFALSFVRTGKDVLRLRHLLEEADATQPIVAKIEKPEAWQNLDSILEESDGIMVARGDLGVEMALEKVPIIQKAIIERSRYYGRFVITATQMLESMVEHPLPTRAEVSDIANAIYDGTSAVMLSAETSTGKYPDQSGANDGQDRARDGSGGAASGIQVGELDVPRYHSADYRRCRVPCGAFGGRFRPCCRYIERLNCKAAGALSSASADIRVHVERKSSAVALHHLRRRCDCRACAHVNGQNAGRDGTDTGVNRPREAGR